MVKMGISAKQYQQRLQPILNKSTMEQLVKEIVLSDKETLKERKINELERGLRPNEKRIGGYQNGEYANEKNQMNPLAGFGNVDLIYSGSFVSKLFLKSYSNNPRGYIFDSTDSKTDNLVGKYGLDILGLNQEWFNKRQSEIYRYTLVYQIIKNYKIA